MFRTKFAAAAASLTLVCGAAQAANYTFDSVGDQLVTSFTSTQFGVNLGAVITYQLTTLGSSSATFLVTLQNTTSTASAGDNRLVGFGITTVQPTLTSVSDNDTSWSTNVTSNVTSYQVDFCGISSGGTNCSGGGGGGVGEGGSKSFNFTMNFGSPLTSSGIVFGSPYVARFQSIGSVGGSAALCSVNEGCTDGNPPPNRTPEPGSLALAGGALLALAAVRRRQRKH